MPLKNVFFEVYESARPIKEIEHCSIGSNALSFLALRRFRILFSKHVIIAVFFCLFFFQIFNAS
jgi:hypothetical protein